MNEKEDKILESLNEIKSILKILAYSEFEKHRHSLISTQNKEKIYDLCSGDKEMGEISKKATISNEAVRLTIRGFEKFGLVITKRVGNKLYPKRVM